MIFRVVNVRAGVHFTIGDTRNAAIERLSPRARNTEDIVVEEKDGYIWLYYDGSRLGRVGH